MFLGVALIQAVLAAIGMMIMDVPDWGLWPVLVLGYGLFIKWLDDGEAAIDQS